MNKPIHGFEILLCITLAVPAYGQEFIIGVAGGLHFADFKTTITDPTVTNFETKSRTLFGIGGLFGVSLNEYLSLQLEPMYIEKGSIYTEGTMQEVNIKSSQIDLPLLATLGIGKEVRPFVVVGPYASILLDASMSTEFSGSVWEGDFQQVLKQTEYGMLFGAGIGIPIWRGSVFLEGRYALGLTNLNKGGSFDLKSGSLVGNRFSTDPKDDIKTRGVLVTIGYQLPLHGE